MSTQTEPVASQKKILLVEDDLYIRDLYMQILRVEGYDVDVSSDGEDAYKKIYNTAYDLILLDIMLPKMSGIEILEKINQDEEKKHISHSIVLLTNLSQDTLVAKAVTLGIRGYLVKGDYTPDQVISEVQNYLTQ